MSTFNDSMGQSWTVEFDGLLLDDVYQATGIDLADLSAGGLAAIEQDAKKLVKVLLVLCEPKDIDERTFSKRIVRDVIPGAIEAIVSAAANFFPPKQWSEIQSRLDQQREFDQNWAKIRPIVAKLNDPDMPAALREAVMGALTEAMGEMTPDTTSPADTQADYSEVDDILRAAASVTGQDVTPPMLAPSVQGNSGLAPGD